MFIAAINKLLLHVSMLIQNFKPHRSQNTYNGSTPHPSEYVLSMQQPLVPILRMKGFQQNLVSCMYSKPHMRWYIQDKCTYIDQTTSF